MDPHWFEPSTVDIDRCRTCNGFRSEEQHQAFIPRGFVDIRGMHILQMLDQCKCGELFIQHLHLRHDCPDCGMKYLYPPDGIKPKSWREELGDGWKSLMSFLQSLWKK